MRDVFRDDCTSKVPATSATQSKVTDVKELSSPSSLSVSPSHVFTGGKKTTSTSSPSDKSSLAWSRASLRVTKWSSSFEGGITALRIRVLRDCVLVRLVDGVSEGVTWRGCRRTTVCIHWG